MANKREVPDLLRRRSHAALGRYFRYTKQIQH
jgi:hypothetical protein